jgi:O-methyltransferase domain
LLIEAVIQPGNQPDLMKLIDIEMLLIPGGRERSADEFAALFSRAGFELTRIVPTESPLAVVAARVR